MLTFYSAFKSTKPLTQSSQTIQGGNSFGTITKLVPLARILVQDMIDSTSEKGGIVVSQPDENLAIFDFMC